MNDFTAVGKWSGTVGAHDILAMRISESGLALWECMRSRPSELSGTKRLMHRSCGIMQVLEYGLVLMQEGGHMLAFSAFESVGCVTGEVLMKLLGNMTGGD